MATLSQAEIRKIIERYALINAYKYDGKAQTSSVMSSIISTEPDMRPHAKNIKPIVDEIVNSVNSMSMESIKNAMEQKGAVCLHERGEAVEQAEGLPPLPGLEGNKRPVFRLAPYPSGPLHIGNARMVILNAEYARLTNGKIILCFDDTIGAMQKDIESEEGAKFVVPEAYDMIREGLEWLGVKWQQEFYKSERLPVYYQYCVKVIKMNMAYACNCDVETFRDLKNAGMSCPHHDMPPKETLEIFQGMLDGKYNEGEVVIRLKTGVDLKDPALREPVIMRISFAKHPRVGNDYIVWPLLEFSWGIDDHEFGITHIIRGKDLYKEDFIEEFLWNLFGWKKKTILHFGILMFEGIKLSKTRARQMIQSGEYLGWDDPRTWSMQSLARRGISPEAVRKSLLDLRLSLNDISFSYTQLYANNKQYIEKCVVAFSFIPDPVKWFISEIPRSKWVARVLVNPFVKNGNYRDIEIEASKGKKVFYLSEASVDAMKKSPVRLKDLFNIQKINGELHYHSEKPEGMKSSIPWIDGRDGNNVDVQVLMPDGSVVSGKGESSIMAMDIGQVVYFDHFGFARIDEITDDGIVAWFAH